MKVSNGLTTAEELQLIKLMGKLKAKWTPKLYQAMAPNFALTAVETVFLTKSGDELYVLLHNRPQDDIPEWRNKPASPGSMVRANDIKTRFNGFENAILRVQKNELGNVPIMVSEKPVGAIFRISARGAENSVIFVCRLVTDPFDFKSLDEPPIPGFWWQPVSQLPKDLIDDHDKIIDIACKHWYTVNKISV